MNNLDVMFWKPLEKFKEVNWFRWRVPFRMIRIPTVNNSSIKRGRNKLFLHITIVTKKHQNFFYLKKIFLISIHRLRSKGEKTNCGFTQLCKQTEKALNNFLGMRNVVYCFTVFVMDVATFFDALFEYRPEENKAQWKYFPGKIRNWSKIGIS